MDLTASSNSYALAAETRQLALEGAEGFNTDEGIANWEARLSAHLATCSDKIAACVAVVRRAEAEAEIAKAEAARWNAAVARYGAVAACVTERLAAILHEQEDATGNGKAIVGPGWVAIRRRTSTRTEVTVEPDALPFAFQRIKVEADKVAIKNALEAGETIAGCELVQVVSESVAFSK